MISIIISCLMTLAITSAVDNRTGGDTTIPRLQLALTSCTKIEDADDLQKVIVHGMDCQCEINFPPAIKRDDYKYTPGMGAHKLHTKGATFNEARKICFEEGGHLAIIDSVEEEKILCDLFTKTAAEQESFKDTQAYLGIHDLFAEGEWLTIFNDPLDKRGYHKWSTDDGYGGQPDNFGGNQHCGTLWKPGRATGMDDIACNSLQSFFCEIPEAGMPKTS